MYNSGDFVTVVNRTTKTLKGVWNGRHFDITPGKHGYPLIVAEAIKRQNPIMGSGNDWTEALYLVGIEEFGDDVSPIEQSPAVERMNSAVLHGDKQMTPVMKPTGMYSRNEMRPIEVNSPVESSFEKP